MNEKTTSKSSPVPGMAAIGSVIVAIGSVILATVAAQGDDFTGAGVCMVAAALSLGLLANAVFRN
jgi:hypothetical protein